MRHAKRTVKLNRTSAHRRCMIANMLKSLIIHGRITTTVPKAKELRRHAERMITLAKRSTNIVQGHRGASAHLMVRYNTLTPKEQRAAKAGDLSSYNDDRKVINTLFSVLKPRFVDRPGGYTRIIRTGHLRVGDNAEECIIEFI